MGELLRSNMKLITKLTEQKLYNGTERYGTERNGTLVAIFIPHRTRSKLNGTGKWKLEIGNFCLISICNQNSNAVINASSSSVRSRVSGTSNPDVRGLRPRGVTRTIWFCLNQIISSILKFIYMQSFTSA